MGLFEDIKTKADLNGDGKLSLADLDGMRDGNNSELIDKMKAVADRNEDGKLSLDDVKNFNLGDAIKDIKNKFF